MKAAVIIVAAAINNTLPPLSSYVKDNTNKQRPNINAFVINIEFVADVHNNITINIPFITITSLKNNATATISGHYHTPE